MLTVGCVSSAMQVDAVSTHKTTPRTYYSSFDETPADVTAKHLVGKYFEIMR